MGNKPADLWELTPIETERALRCAFYREAVVSHAVWSAFNGKDSPPVTALQMMAKAAWREAEQVEDDEDVDPVAQFRSMAGLPAPASQPS